VVVNLIAAQMVSSQTERFSASLSGGNEVPPINSAGIGNFRMTIRPEAINFSFLPTCHRRSACPTCICTQQSRRWRNIFLCGEGNQPACPATTSGTIAGTITAANVTGPTGQGIAAGALDSALEAVRDGLSYANMHTRNFPGGEIRGNVQRGGGHGNAAE
jgi:hypothetical protein